jgi:thiamine transport system permease protein
MRWWVPGLVLGALMAGLLPILGVVDWRVTHWRFDPYIGRVFRFTIWQAGLSTVLSVVPALAISHGLSRREFPGKSILLALLNAPMAMPAIVVVLALVSLFGQQGWLPGWVTLYGLPGILLAHVFFNLPLATRLLLASYSTIPGENFRLAAQLSFTDAQVYRRVIWPVLWRVMPQIGSLIFLLCAASFVIVLTLGGGPAATTLEVAVYQALRQDFDLPRAAVLALLQIGLGVVLTGFIGRFAGGALASPTLGFGQRFDGKSFAARAGDYIGLIILGLVILPPFIVLAVEGILRISFDVSLLTATGWSIGLGSISGFLSTLLAWNMAHSAARDPWLNRLSSGIGLASLIIPPAVLATGWFLMLRTTATSLPSVCLLVIAFNCLMALPFASATLGRHVAQLASRTEQLCQSLGMNRWSRILIIDFPLLRRPLFQAFLVSTLIGIGDLTALTLFDNHGLVTLPKLIALQMGNYRGTQAAGTTLVLAGLCITLSLIAQHLGGRRDYD